MASLPTPMFIVSDEHGVMIGFGFVGGRFRALVDKFFSHKRNQHLTVDAAVLQQIGIYTPHIRMCRWQSEGLALPHRLRLYSQIAHAGFSAEEHRHGIGKAKTVELLNEVDGEPAFFRGMLSSIISSYYLSLSPLKSVQRWAFPSLTTPLGSKMALFDPSPKTPRPALRGGVFRIGGRCATPVLYPVLKSRARTRSQSSRTLPQQGGQALSGFLSRSPVQKPHTG